MGSQVPSANGRMRPSKLETWRMTSPSKDLLDAAAVIYGGEVTEWAGAPGGKQYELFTDTPTLDVIIPPGEMAFHQWHELWSGGGCLRRCDGITEQFSQDPCICPADRDVRREMSGKGTACKPTTRLFVIQPHLPDVGMWQFESHGFYAAVELAASIDVLRQVAQTAGLIPAKLRIEQRQSKHDGKTSNFAVPVIELPTLTPHSLMTGEIVAIETTSGVVETREIERPAQVALPAPAKVAPAKVAAPRKSAASKLPATGGTAFSRAITARAHRANLDAETVDAICVEIAGVPAAQVSDPTTTNKILEAIDLRVAGAPF